MIGGERRRPRSLRYPRRRCNRENELGLDVGRMRLRGAGRVCRAFDLGMRAARWCGGGGSDGSYSSNGGDGAGAHSPFRRSRRASAAAALRQRPVASAPLAAAAAAATAAATAARPRRAQPNRGRSGGRVWPRLAGLVGYWSCLPG